MKNLNVSQQRALPACKANGVLGSISRGTAEGTRRGSSPSVLLL